MRLRKRGSGWLVDTPAKLNLFLEVLGKRTDGCHEIETLMVAIDRYDTLSFKEDNSGSIQFDLQPPKLNRWRASRRWDDSDVPRDRDNLVVQAAELLREFAGIRSGVRIGLTKRIPVAAGLAGGSSDAAATLVALNHVWRLRLTNADLRGLGARIGSDISFFVASRRAAVCRGRGEIVEPVAASGPLHFVVARPATGLSTADVYAHCTIPERPASIRGIQSAVRDGRALEVARLLHNRLQKPAEQLNTDVTRLKGRFETMCLAGHAMTGSGTGYFGVCHTRRQATVLARRLQADGMEFAFAAAIRS